MAGHANIAEIQALALRCRTLQERKKNLQLELEICTKEIERNKNAYEESQRKIQNKALSSLVKAVGEDDNGTKLLILADAVKTFAESDQGKADEKLLLDTVKLTVSRKRERDDLDIASDDENEHLNVEMNTDVFQWALSKSVPFAGKMLVVSPVVTQDPVGKKFMDATNAKDGDIIVTIQTPVINVIKSIMQEEKVQCGENRMQFKMLLE